MKLLLDENLSSKIVALLEDQYPGSTHVREIGLKGAPDRLIWGHARHQGFVVVSKDDDFRQRSFLEGAPPKVIWLKVGNAGTSEIADLLRSRVGEIREFENDKRAALLILQSNLT